MKRAVTTFGFVFLILLQNSETSLAQETLSSAPDLGFGMDAPPNGAFNTNPFDAPNRDSQTLLAAPPRVDPKDAAKLAKIQTLESQIRSRDDKDKAGRDDLVQELTTLMEEVFDADFARRDASVKQLEDRVAKLRETLDKRKAARGRIISNRIDGLLLDADGLAFPLLAQRGDAGADTFRRPLYDIVHLQKKRDGSLFAKVNIPRLTQESRTRQVPYTVMVPTTRTKNQGGVASQYTVMVPETRNRTQQYTVQVPRKGTTHEITIPKGQDVQRFVDRFAEKELLRRTRQAKGQGQLFEEPPGLGAGDESGISNLFVGDLLDESMSSDSPDEVEQFTDQPADDIFDSDALDHGNTSFQDDNSLFD